MCRLLGIKNFNYLKNSDLLEAFWELAVEGNVPPGNSKGHYDGWGIGWYENGSARVLKSGGSAAQEKTSILSKLREIGESKVLVCHLRKSAWHDTSTTRHAHPFEFKNMIFAHNGTISKNDFSEMLKHIKSEYLPESDPYDTEVFFRYIAQYGSMGLKAAFNRALGEIKKMEYSALNSLLTDGETLLAFRDYTRNGDYYSLFRAEDSGSPVICSEAGIPRLQWSPLSNAEVAEL